MNMRLEFPRQFAFALALACVPALGFAQNSASPSDMNNSASNLSASDKKFVRDAAQGGMAEVELGKLAAEKGSSDEVKKFGQRMVDDHSKANDQLKQIAGSQGIELPQNLNSKDKALKDRLSKLSGASFDKVYMTSMVRDHKTDIADFTKESNSGKDEAVKQFATTTLPTLKDHLQEAERIEPMVKGSSTRASK